MEQLQLVSVRVNRRTPIRTAPQWHVAIAASFR
jgi:hypothetical protein